VTFLESLCRHSLERRWPNAKVHRLAAEPAWVVSIYVTDRELMRANREDALADSVCERRVQRKRHPSLGWRKRR